MKRIRRILYASDFSRSSRAALGPAVGLAKLTRAELTVVHVLSPAIPAVGEGYVLPQVYDRLLAEIRGQAQKRLDRLLAEAKESGVRARSLLLEGIPHDGIVRAARSRRADLVVMGTHGYTGFTRLFLGSVAARVVALAPCPVLTVRARARA